MEGFVYLLHANKPFEECYKIGMTTNPKQRFRTFNVKLPYPVDVVICTRVIDCRGAESDFHAEFADKRLDGEWFKLDEVDLLIIVSVLLATEAANLIVRLIERITAAQIELNNIDFDESDTLTRLVRALYHASQRRDRRRQKANGAEILREIGAPLTSEEIKKILADYDRACLESDRRRTHDTGRGQRVHG